MQNGAGDEESVSPPPPVHAKACSATNAGARSDGGLWLNLLSLAAAWIATRRRR
jgi:hypothetical protein